VHLFLLLSAPLAYIYLLILRDQSGRTPEMTAISALKGALAHLVVLVSLVVVERVVREPFSGPGLYFYGAVYDLVLPVYLGVLLYLWFTKDVGGLSPDESFVSLASFFAGSFTVAGVMDLFLRAEYLGVYELFHLPALRIGVLLMVPTLYYQYSNETFWIRYLYAAVIVVLPFAFGFVGLLTSANYPLAASIITAFLFLLSWAVALFWAGSRPSFGFR
jgi:hypothetical protein